MSQKEKEVKILLTHLKNINMYQSFIDSTVLQATARIYGLQTQYQLNLPFANSVKVINLVNSPISGTL